CPQRATSARACSRVAAPRAHRATSAPAPANCSAIARPMPRLAPATTTRLPVKSKDIVISLKARLAATIAAKRLAFDLPTPPVDVATECQPCLRDGAPAANREGGRR